MLRVSRQDVLDHLAAFPLAWREDPSSNATRRSSEPIRRGLIPSLESQFNPAVRDALARTASVRAEEAELLATIAAAVGLRCRRRRDPPARSRRRGPAGGDADRGTQCGPRGGRPARGLPRSRGRDHRPAARPSASGRRLPLPGGRDAAIHFDEIRIGPAGPAPPPFDAALDVPGRAPLPDGRWVVARPLRRPGPRAIGVPAGPLTVRTRRPGDRVRSAGREMSLKRFLMDRRIPAADRDRLPVVASGHTVVWVEGQDVDGAPGPHRHVRLSVTRARP